MATGRSGWGRMLIPLLCWLSAQLLFVQSGRGEDSAFMRPEPIYPKTPLLKKGLCIAFAGDSITAQKHWSSFIETYLRVCRPDLKLRFLQSGLSGERAPEYATRIPVELLPFHPDLVLTLYGMNDSGFRPYHASTGSAYGAGLDSIITQLAKAGVAVVVGVYAFAYNTMVRAKAKHGAELPVCGSDGIHFGPNGGFDFAYAFLKTLGLDGDQGMITIDCKAGKASSPAGIPC